MFGLMLLVMVMGYPFWPAVNNEVQVVQCTTRVRSRSAGAARVANLCQYRRMAGADAKSVLHGQFAQAARDLQGEGDTQHTLDRGVGIAAQLIPGCDFAGVSIVHADGTIDTPARTATLVAEVDRLQYAVRQGPCLDAIRVAETVSSPDLTHEQRWPLWAPRVAALGIASMLCVRLYTSRDTLGALNLLSRTRDAFHQDDVTTASHLAAHLAVALAESQHAEDLHSGALNRTVIGQAEGILMERFSLAPSGAFEVLSRVAQEQGAALHRVAADLVRTRVTPGGEFTDADLRHPSSPVMP
jgi:GAF domain-containing protein